MKRPVHDLKNDIAAAVRAGLERGREEGKISFETIPDFVVETPKDKAHGDFAVNVAMIMAKQAHMAPRQIAEIIIAAMEPDERLIDKVEVAGAGFLNFYLKSDWLKEVPAIVHNEGGGYGSVDIGRGRRVQVEFVSANPTGLLHMGNARGGAIGDSLGNLLKFAGYDVEKEFYINDAGNQIHLLGLSLNARFLQALGEDVVFPEDGYHGDDIKATVERYIAENGDGLRNKTEAERIDILADYALKEKIADMRRVLGRYGIDFDVWFSERSLHESGKVASAMAELKEKGIAYEKDGSLLLKAENSGEKDGKTVKDGERVNLEDKDDVLVRANGVPTYFAADIAYHKDKFDRGFDKVINIWGADHHGHVARMKRAVSFFGYDPEQLTVILMQLVKLYQNGELVTMSKRSGQYVTLEDLIDDVGYDAARYFFVMRNPDSPMDFDLDLARSQTSDNPVFYVQYAHARICSILRQAEASDMGLPDLAAADHSVLGEEQELVLLRKLAELPEEVAVAAELLEPHRLCAYLHDLAAAFHSFYNHCRVNCDDPTLRAARLSLAKAVAVAIANVLALLGVSAPTEM